MTQRQSDPAPGAEPERGFLLAVLSPSEEAAEIAELGELARAAGVEPVGSIVQHRSQPDRRTYVGKGKLEELKQAYGGAHAESLLVDDELSPPQQRNLENALSARVVDRTQLILDIFAQHARSSEGKLQVELAQLEYNLPRMRGLWQHLERLAGGTATAVGGGVGTRGPGETQLETDRRLARRRITLLKRRLKGLGKQREGRRKARKRNEVPTVALAGYTNVGKSTLLNALTGAGVSVNNRLFETLDPTTRGFEFDGRRYLVTDTVGFIRRLPHQLVEGFAATLEETLVSDLVLHVIDASASDEEIDETTAAVNAVLTEIRADELPRELVLNKIDAVDPLTRRRLSNRFPDALQVSARDRGGAGRAPRAHRRAVCRPLRTGAAPDPVRARTQAERALRPRSPDRRTGGSRRGRARGGEASAPRADALRAVPRRRRGGAGGLTRVKLQIQRLRPDAVLPGRAYPGDAGLDLVACEHVTLAPGERASVGTGLAVAIPEGHAGFVQARSGLAARDGITIVNAPGLIDAGYRGEILVILLNTDRETSFTVEPGMRIAQLVLLELPETELVEVEALPPSERGPRGHGSSGS